MDKLTDLFSSLGKAFQSSTVSSVLTILVLFALFFFSIRLMTKNNARWLVAIFTAYVLLTGIIFISTEFPSGQRKLFLIFPILFAVALISLFATEIKREIWDLGIKKTGETRHIDRSVTDPAATKCIDEIIKALQNMSKNDVGAIIILGSGNLPKAVIDSGITLNSEVSSALIESIFFPKTPLHDGAMVINGTKIEAAGCFLPLAQEINLPKELGSRHRAGIGITEAINVTALIVSEETGIISIAQGGKIRRYADSEMLKKTLKEYYWQEFIGKGR